MADTNDLVLDCTIDAPRAAVWKALTTPELLTHWWAPRPYRTVACEMEVRPGGRFFTRMTGPDGFDMSGAGCILEIAEEERFVWTNTLGGGYRPNPAADAGCGEFPFTAVMTFEDAGEGRTRYRAVAMHANDADRETHEKMGFHEGWGAVARQLEEVAKSLT